MLMDLMRFMDCMTWRNLEGRMLLEFCLIHVSNTWFKRERKEESDILTGRT